MIPTSQMEKVQKGSAGTTSTNDADVDDGIDEDNLYDDVTTK